LLARIEALLRRAAQVPKTLEAGALSFDIMANKAFLNGRDLLLKPKEFSLLLLLVQNEDKLMSAERLYEAIWKAPLNDDNRTLQSNISALRKKLEDRDCGYTLRAVYGKGYCFEKI
jgi:DNA-binding response OmpR family regulator